VSKGKSYFTFGHLDTPFAPYLILLLITFFLPRAFSQTPLAFTRNARTYETVHSSLVEKAMAHACLGMLTVPDAVPCNPAMTPLTQENDLNATILVSNGYSNLKQVEQLMNGQLDQQTLQSLFSSNQILQAEAQADLFFRSSFFAAEYSPISAKFYSVARNEANPVVQVIGVKEETFLAQTGTAYFKPLYLGLRIREVNRDFVDTQARVLDIVANPNLVRPNHQQLVFFEPAATMFFAGRWKPRASVMIENGGFGEGDTTDLINPTTLRANVAVSPEIGWGILDLELEYRQLRSDDQPDQRFHFGANYQFGIMSAVFGVDYDGISGGIYYMFNQANAGIIYSTTQVPWRSSDYYFQTVYVQAGWRF
jgi:hypothetical protein